MTEPLTEKISAPAQVEEVVTMSDLNHNVPKAPCRVKVTIMVDGENGEFLSHDQDESHFECSDSNFSDSDEIEFTLNRLEMKKARYLKRKSDNLDTDPSELPANI